MVDQIVRLAESNGRTELSEMVGVSERALKYCATKRILKLSQPKQKKYKSQIFQIPRIRYPTDPTYDAVKSRGFKKLATPSLRRARQKFNGVHLDSRCTYQPVRRGALKYEISPKLRKLAKHKRYEEISSKDPYQVTKKALRKLSKQQKEIFLKKATPIPWKVTRKKVFSNHELKV